MQSLLRVRDSLRSPRRVRLAVRSLALAVLAGAVALTLWPLQTGAVPAPALKCTLPEDFPIPGGWFFQQLKRSSLEEFCLGYSVVDDSQAAMWTEFYRLGGVKVFGYPVSRRYIGPGGYIQQAFEFGVLQWRPEENRAVPALIFEQFHDATDAFGRSFDSKLRFFSIPEPVAPPPGGFADQVAVRQSWLTEPQIMARYMTDPRTGQPWPYQELAWEFYGLPQGPPERITYAGDEFYPLLAPFVTQRFQRFAFRLFLADDPTIQVNRAGCVGTVRSGALARELRLLSPATVLEEPVFSQPIIIAEPLAEQFVPPAGETPVLVNVVVSLLNFAPNETVSITAVALNKPENRAPFPWEQDIPFTVTTDGTGQGEAIVQLWTVSYLLDARGPTSGARVAQQLSVTATALDEFEVARCQALTSSPSILLVPTPFVVPTPTPAPTTPTPAAGR